MTGGGLLGRIGTNVFETNWFCVKWDVKAVTLLLFVSELTCYFVCLMLFLVVIMSCP